MSERGSHLSDGYSSLEDRVVALLPMEDDKQLGAFFINSDSNTELETMLACCLYGLIFCSGIELEFSSKTGRGPPLAAIRTTVVRADRIGPAQRKNVANGTV